jgi:hypothetical protein
MDVSCVGYKLSSMRQCMHIYKQGGLRRRREGS